MRFPSAALLASGLLATSASARFVMYADEWHPTRPTNPADRAGIDHVVLAFAMANATATFQPKVPITTIRSEYPNAKIMIAVGGWGDDIGFAEMSKSDATIAKFASDIATMLTNTGADGVDIDWEYPGGNSADYKQVPNSAKAYQIDAYPKTLSAIRAAIGNKLLSIAVPGKKEDMIGFTSETGPKIWKPVDYINVMAYDLANRRDNVTKHHSSVAGSEEAIRNYLAIDAPPEKINLGFAYYAKYFTTQGDCGSSPLGCPIVPAEDPVTGQDLLTSGAWTFEPAHMKPIDSSALPISYDGTCGPDKGTKCASGCCSQYGNCGTSPQHCSGACWHAFGVGCTDADVAGSWQIATKNGMTDQTEGGQYFFDKTNKLFWTWDTPQLISRKFKNIVQKHKLGGVMAWSLGEDSYDWSHIRQMAAELKRIRTGGNTFAPGKSQSAQMIPPVAQTFDAVRGVYTEIFSTVSQPTPSSSPYNVVFVDGTALGPTGEPSTEPGSPPDFTVDVNGGHSVKPVPNNQVDSPPTASYIQPKPASPNGAPAVPSSYQQPYEEPNKPYVAPINSYATPAIPSSYTSPSPVPEDVSKGPVQPYVAPANSHVDSPVIASSVAPTEPYVAPAGSALPVAPSSALYVAPVDPSAALYAVPTASLAVPYVAPVEPSAAPYVAPVEPSAVPYVAPVESSASLYAVPAASLAVPYVAPVQSSTDPYVAPTDASVASSVAPSAAPYAAPANSSLAPYVAPVAPSAVLYTVAAASVDPSPPPYPPPVAPAASSAAPSSPPTDPYAAPPAGLATPPSPPTPTRPIHPDAPDFTPDPGYINPNWHPAAAPGPPAQQASAALPAPAAPAEQRVDVGFGAATAPAVGLGEEASNDAAMVQHQRGKSTCQARAKRQRGVKRRRRSGVRQ